MPSLLTAGIRQTDSSALKRIPYVKLLLTFWHFGILGSQVTQSYSDLILTPRSPLTDKEAFALRPSHSLSFERDTQGWRSLSACHVFRMHVYL